MKTSIELVTHREAARLISTTIEDKLSKIAQEGFHRCLRSSSVIWVGSRDGKLVCMFGLISPTLADDRAYLWLHTTDAVKDCEFTFVRQSQLAIRQMLETFPVIYGHCETPAKRSRRWVKWLGATFGQPEGALIPFQIVKPNV